MRSGCSGSLVTRHSSPVTRQSSPRTHELRPGRLIYTGLRRSPIGEARRGMKGKSMSSSVKAACLLLALLSGASQNAYSVVCYQILERDDAPIYSGTEPPFPMEGQEYNDAQHQLRATERHLLWFDAPTCPLQTGRSLSLTMRPGDTVARSRPAPAPPRTAAVRNSSKAPPLARGEK